MPKWKDKDAIHPSKRTRVAGRVSPHVPSEVDPQNRDFNVKQILRSSPNPVVASVETPREFKEHQYAVDFLL